MATQYRPVEAASIDRRTARRLTVRVDRATARRHGATAREATVHDLSVYGCRLALDNDHAPGDRIWIRFDGGLPVAATVVWHDDGFSGCRFDTAIDRGMLRKLTIGGCQGQ